MPPLLTKGKNIRFGKYYAISHESLRMNAESDLLPAGQLPAVQLPDVLSADCPSRAVLKHLTSQWGVLVLLALRGGTLRFSGLRRRIGGISERMLAQTLDVLEGDGLVLRQAHPVVPPHVDYSLSPLGAEAARRVAELTGWIEANLAALRAPAEPGARP